MMNLYVYDHCPYCVKARMIFGYKNIDFNLLTLLNDDVDTPVKMIGKKMVPILEHDRNSFMAESLDIISHVDHLDSKPYLSGSEDSNLTAWLSQSREYLYLLAMPRWIKAPLEEFKTKEAVNYFTIKKEDYIGSFKKHMNNTSELIKKAEIHLEKLNTLLNEDSPYYLKNQASLNDIHLYPTLRSLSVVKGLTFPDKVLSYMKSQEKLSKIPLHFDIAL